MPPRRKKTARNIFLFILLIGSLSAAGFYGFEYWRLRQAHFVHYPEFGIPVPSDYSIHGIDVSKYQSYVDWEEVSQMKVKDISIGFVFMKATEGLDNTDHFFKRNWQRAKDAGLTRGAYHFFIAGKSGREQAEHFIEEVDLQKGDLPPVLDIEQTYGYPADKLAESLTVWLNVTENYYNTKPIIYTNVDFYNKYLKGHFDDYPLWIAHYLEPAKPRISRDWWFWQHNEQGKVNGILYNVDFNVFNGDSTDFAGILIR